jgi:hypothetical protein
VAAHLFSGGNYGTEFHLEYPNASLSKTRRHDVTNRVVLYADTDQTTLEYMPAPIAFFGLFDIIVDELDVTLGVDSTGKSSLKTFDIT